MRRRNPQRRHVGSRAVPAAPATSPAVHRVHWDRGCRRPRAQRHSAPGWRAGILARNERESTAQTQRAAPDDTERSSAASGAPEAAPRRARVAEQRFARSER